MKKDGMPCLIKQPSGSFGVRLTEVDCSNIPKAYVASSRYVKEKKAVAAHIGNLSPFLCAAETYVVVSETSSENDLVKIAQEAFSPAFFFPLSQASDLKQASASRRKVEQICVLSLNIIAANFKFEIAPRESNFATRGELCSCILLITPRRPVCQWGLIWPSLAFSGLPRPFRWIGIGRDRVLLQFPEARGPLYDAVSSSSSSWSCF